MSIVQKTYPIVQMNSINFKSDKRVIIDVLSDVLTTSKMGNSVICKPNLSAPWGMNFEIANKAMFHLITKGSCLLKSKTMNEPVRLIQGDILLIPKCKGHRLIDSETSIVKPFREVIAHHKKIMPNRLNNVTSMLCGVYSFRNYEYNPILSLLPDIIHISASEVQQNMKLHALIQLILLESSHGEIGADTAISKFIDTMFIYIVRAWLKQQPLGTTGWLGALKDPRIGLAISLIHKTPSYRWTVELLANNVSMSRSSFAQKFNLLVGEPPLSYLTRLRMDLSSQLLSDTNQKLRGVAAEVGYDSETAFSKTFKKFTNMSPGEYRNQYKKVVK